MSEVCMTLIPYDKREGIPLNVAAERAGKSSGTIRNWCIEHGIGRRVGGGQWIVSKVALAMFLHGNDIALARYKSGDRSSDCVITYFKRERGWVSSWTKLTGCPICSPHDVTVCSSKYSEPSRIYQSVRTDVASTNDARNVTRMTSACGHAMERQTKLLQFRAPESLSEAIAAAAKRDLQSKSEFVRRSVIDRLRASGITLIPERAA